MSLAGLNLAELAGAVCGLAFTLAVFSYLLGDNPLFRVAIAIFVGVTAAYALVVTWYNVLWPQLVIPLLSGSRSELLFALAPVGLSLLILLKAFPKWSSLGNPAMAFLVGVGAAAAIGGAVLGTLIPQANASINLLDVRAAGQSGMPWMIKLAEGTVILVGTLSSLVYFHFGSRRAPGEPPRRSEAIEVVSWVGQLFIAIAFGVLFAGVYAAALTAFLERVQSILAFFLPLLTTP